MTEEQLKRAEIIKLEKKQLESILYYADIYKEQAYRNCFSFIYYDEVGNQRTVDLLPIQNNSFLEYVQTEINKLTKEFNEL